MAWERKLMRTVRCQNDQQRGTLARLLAAVADEGGSIGEIEMIREGSQREVRDIVVFAEDETQLDSIIRAMSANPGTRVLEVRDQVLELHQKGKIAIRSRYTIDSLATLRKVYTPGVAEVCLKIARPRARATIHSGVASRCDCD